MKRRPVIALAALAVALCALAGPALAQDPSASDYRDFFGLSPRLVVWIIAEIHLMFGAFVLGVPIFSVLMEYVGLRTGKESYDELARECTKLLSAAFATTASLGGLLAFTLVGLYPKVMRHLSGAMHQSFYVYALLFFGETFTLYLYYYSWDRMRGTGPRAPRLRRWLGWPVGILAVVALPLVFYSFFFNAEGAIPPAREPAAPTEIAEARASAGAGAGAEAGAEAAAASTAGTGASAEAGAASRDRPRTRAAFGWPTKATKRLYAAVRWIVPAFFALYCVFAWASGRKALHVFLGVLLNGWGIALMLIANSWATFMMSPTGHDPDTLRFIGTTWEAVSNPLWRPLNLHRLLGNVAFGGFVVGAYAAVRFLAARTREARAHYDWMGYVGNFVGVCGLLPLPFAGYYLGREVYSHSPVMGNDMMGGFFSWTFVLQAVLIGVLFIGANFYLWAGMGRIPGAERYRPAVKWILAALVLCFMVWVTPHNLPLSPEEQGAMGGQYHPVLKYLGLMPAKNAAVNFILLSTFASFLLYRRGNKAETVSLGEQGRGGRIVLLAILVLTLALVGSYAFTLFELRPRDIGLERGRGIFQFHAAMLVAQMAMQVVAVLLTLRGRGKLGQGLLWATSGVLVTGVFGVSGFVVLQDANPFLRNLAVCQVLLVLSCMVLVTTIDVLVFRGAREVGGIRWGEIGNRAQYALVLLCVAIVMTMGLMGYVRSGLRQDWHIFGVLQDTSAEATSPNIGDMTTVVGLITIGFLALVTFVFWLGLLGEKPRAIGAEGSR